jgi:hypothetical protein
MTFKPLSSGNKFSTNINQINEINRRLEKEQQAKVFNGPNNSNAIIIGRYAANLYGFVQADSSNERHILLGQAPDGREGFWIIKTGYDVIDELDT